MKSSRHTPIRVCGLQCKACGGSKESLTMDLCPTCEQIVLRLFPEEYFEPKLGWQKDILPQELEFSSTSLMEVHKLALIAQPMGLAA